jgi:hypothetical protein
MNVRRTRIAGLGFSNTRPGTWRFVDIHEGVTRPLRLVGPNYATKDELLADLDRYARESWGYGNICDGVLEDYMVGVKEGEDSFWYFNCQANDPDHAKEQAEGHGSSITVMAIYKRVG